MAEQDELVRDAVAMGRQPGEGDLAAIRRLGSDLAKIDELITQHEAALEKLGKQRTELAHRTIPDAMDDAGTDRVGLANIGRDIVVRPYYKAVLPKDDEVREQGIDWLRGQGHGSLLRTTLSVEFHPGEDEHALNVAVLIRSYFRGRNVEQHEPTVVNGVHWKTLTSFVREQVERGVALPLDLLGAVVGRVAEIKDRKKR